MKELIARLDALIAKVRAYNADLAARIAYGKRLPELDAFKQRQKQQSNDNKPV